MGALFNPTRRKQEGIKWPFLAHTVAMFLLLTTFVTTVLCQETASYIDNRGFPGLGSLPPGPIGYWRLTTARAPTVISYLPPVLNGWLADGLLVRDVLDPVVNVSHVVRPLSSIVVTLSMP